MAFYNMFGKRLLDLLVGGLAFLVLLPLILLIAALVAVKLGQPVLFRQQRTGWRRLPFNIIKFRTMLDSRDAQGQPLPDSVRLTKFGRFLRDWSLDELPTLWN